MIINCKPNYSVILKSDRNPRKIRPAITHSDQFDACAFDGSDHVGG